MEFTSNSLQFYNFLTIAVIIFTLKTNISVDATKKYNAIFEAFSEGLKLVAKADADLSIAKLPEVKEKWPCRRFEYSHGGGAYLFKEYAPATFRKMRETAFLVADSVYYKSLTSGELSERFTTGLGGSRFFISADKRFMLKSVKPRERIVLKTHLGKYAVHMANNPNSFLTKYYGLYSVERQSHRKGQSLEESSDEALWFFVMDNILYTKPTRYAGIPTLMTPPPSIDVRVDLKGYWLERKAAPREWTKAEPEFVEWEFNNPANEGRLFPRGIALDPHMYKLVVEVLSKDAQFLKTSFRVQDYSLYMGIHFNTPAEEEKSEQYLQHISNSPGELARMTNGGLAASCSQCREPKEPAVPSVAKADGHDVTEADDAVMNGKDGGQIRSISIFIGIIDMLSTLDLWKRVRRVQKCYIDRACREMEQHTHPDNYATRFQCFMARNVFHMEQQKSVISKEELENKYCQEYDSILEEDGKWTNSDEERKLGTRINRIHGRGNQLRRLLKHKMSGIKHYGQMLH